MSLHEEFWREVASRRFKNDDSRHVDRVVKEANSQRVFIKGGERVSRWAMRTLLIGMIIASSPTWTGILCLAMLIDAIEALVILVKSTYFRP